MRNQEVMPRRRDWRDEVHHANRLSARVEIPVRSPAGQTRDVHRAIEQLEDGGVGQRLRMTAVRDQIDDAGRGSARNAEGVIRLDEFGARVCDFRRGRVRAERHRGPGRRRRETR